MVRVWAITSGERGLGFSKAGMADSTTIEVSLWRKNRSRNDSMLKHTRGSDSPQLACGKAWPVNGPPSHSSSGVKA